MNLQFGDDDGWLAGADCSCVRVIKIKSMANNVICIAYIALLVL